jgi:hypothetical protein
MTHETTEISAKIEEHNQGKITDAELVKFLTDEVKYMPGETRPPNMTFEEAWIWTENRTYNTPGSFEEVEHARDTGLLDPEVYEKVLKVFYSRMDFQ